MPELPDVEGLDWSYAWLHLPSEEMLRMYNLKSYEPVWAKPEIIEAEEIEDVE